MSEVTAELSSFFERAELDQETYEHYADLVFATARYRERFGELAKEYRRTVTEKQGDALKLGVALLILGKYADALEWLERASAGKHRHYYAAQAARALHRWDDALAHLRHAADLGWDSFQIDMQCAALHAQSGDLAKAGQLVERRAREGRDRGEWYFVRGLLAEGRDEREAALELYEKTLTLSPDHPQAMFRAARLYDARGEDEQAVELYQRLARQPRAHVNALINLAVLYEDVGKYDEALACVQRVLKADPNHTRARLFLKDVESSRQMVIDDTIEQRAETANRLLETPVSEFELSVRARNCLKRMRIMTLGDLLKLTEAELLAYKNFGETSLSEIKVLLTKTGLRLGQPPEEIDVATVAEVATPQVPLPPGGQTVLNKSVSELELSVRARRCLQRLNINTLGELIQHSESELLSARNFGVTSLSEIKSRLSEYGLHLAAKRQQE